MQANVLVGASVVEVLVCASAVVGVCAVVSANAVVGESLFFGLLDILIGSL